MKRFFALMVVLAAIPVWSQEPATIGNLKEARDHRKEMAIQYINELKNGALIVRLDQQERRIEYFSKYNNTKEVEKILEQVKKENRAIIDAFKSYYSFSKVYFMAMEDSRLILDGQIGKIRLFNDQGEIDPNAHVLEEKIFIADFSFVEQDTTMYLSSYTPTPNDPNNPRGETYYGGSKTSKPALVIRNDKFQQLRDPFPFYTSFSPFGRVTKKYRLPVRRMQEQLEKYYLKKSSEGSE